MVELAKQTAWLRLKGAIEDLLRRANVGPVEVFRCDREKNGKFARFAGVDNARALLWNAQRDDGGLPALLMLGMFPAPAGPEEGPKSMMSVLEWGGARYLQFGFDQKELVATAKEAVDGRGEPLPDGLVLKPSTVDVCRSLAGVRHWLETKVRTSESHLKSFDAAVAGRKAMHLKYLVPIPGISSDHRGDLEALWAMAVPGRDEFGPVKDALIVFERRWQGVERCRADLHMAGGPPCGPAVAPLRDAMRGAIEALSTAIDATVIAEQQTMVRRSPK